MCHLKDEILTIITHAGKTLQVCVSNTLGLMDDLTKERVFVAIHDLKTVPGLIIQLQTGKKTGQGMKKNNPYSSAHHKKK